MKKILFLLIACITISCIGQNNDSISAQNITINRTVFFPDKNVSLITQTFGQPNSIEDVFDEIDDTPAKKYVYDNGITFFIVHDKIDSFLITSDNYSFTTNGIKVGDNFSSLQAYYPGSFQESDGDSLALWVNYADYIFIGINRNRNGKIESIGMYSY